MKKEVKRFITKYHNLCIGDVFQFCDNHDQVYSYCGTVDGFGKDSLILFFDGENYNVRTLCLDKPLFVIAWDDCNDLNRVIKGIVFPTQEVFNYDD